MFACIGVAPETMFGREDGCHVKSRLDQHVEQMLVAYQPGVVRKDGYTLPLEQGKILVGALVAKHDALLLRYKREADTQQ